MPHLIDAVQNSNLAPCIACIWFALFAILLPACQALTNLAKRLRIGTTKLRAFYFIRQCREGVAAVEFALLAPVFLFFLIPAIDLLWYLDANIRLENLLNALAAYTSTQGKSVTSQTFQQFKTNLTTIAASSTTLAVPTVTVLYNNSSSGTNVGTYYCLSGSPPAWQSTGSSSASCGGSLMSGQYVTITVSASYTSLFGIDQVLPALGTISDTAYVRVQ